MNLRDFIKTDDDESEEYYLREVNTLISLSLYDSRRDANGNLVVVNGDITFHENGEGIAKAEVIVNEYGYVFSEDDDFLTIEAAFNVIKK